MKNKVSIHVHIDMKIYPSYTAKKKPNRVGDTC